MPGVIESAILLGLTSAGLSAGALAIAVPILTYGVIGGLGLGFNLLKAAIFRPNTPPAPRPEDVQQSFRQPTAPRLRHYGKVKVSGPWIFAEAYQGRFYKVLALGQGLVDGIEEYWIDDNRVYVDPNGWVTTPPYETVARIQTRLGLPVEVYYGDLNAVFPDWSNAFRGDGVVSLFATQFEVPDDQIFTVFPNTINTSYRVVIRGVKVTNPVTGILQWNDHAAAIIRDYLTHRDGMRLPEALVSTPLAVSGWQAAYNRTAEPVALKAGGTEPRYRLWGSYRYDERPADVIARMLAGCDGRIVPTPDGGLTLLVGDGAEPDIVIDDSMIVGFGSLTRGRNVMETANVIRATYTDPRLDYQTTDAEQWIDDDAVARNGEIAADLSFTMSPAHGQTRRLMKLEAYRAAPAWVGTVQLNVKGLAALGKPVVRLRYPPYGIDERMEVGDFRFVLEDGGLLSGISIELRSMPAEAHAWDPATEEGTAPQTQTSNVVAGIPDVVDFNATLETRTVGGATVQYALLTFAAPASSLIRTEAQGRAMFAAEWIDVPVTRSSTSAESFVLADGGLYEFQMRHTSAGGRPGAWTASKTVVAGGSPP